MYLLLVVVVFSLISIDRALMLFRLFSFNPFGETYEAPLFIEPCKPTDLDISCKCLFSAADSSYQNPV